MVALLAALPCDFAVFSEHTATHACHDTLRSACYCVIFIPLISQNVPDQAPLLVDVVTLELSCFISHALHTVPSA
jgi:hypothetical protein